MMTGQQGFVAAADMLTNARQATDPSWPIPSDDLITMFQNDLETICGGTAMMAQDNIGDAATGIILADNKHNYLK